MYIFSLPSGWGAFLHFIYEHRAYIEATMTAFVIALLMSLHDGKTWIKSLQAGAICGMVAFTVVNVLSLITNSPGNYSFAAGAAAGGLGVTGCKSVIESIVWFIVSLRGVKKRDD